MVMLGYEMVLDVDELALVVDPLESVTANMSPAWLPSGELLRRSKVAS